jgi:hypothetical protein
MKTDLGCVICGKTVWGHNETFIMETDSNRTYEVLYCESHKNNSEKLALAEKTFLIMERIIEKLEAQKAVLREENERLRRYPNAW